MSVPDDRLAQLRTVVHAAQQVAGALAARSRGDRADAAQLLGGLQHDREVASGAMLVAELSLAMAASAGEQSIEELVRELCLQMESSLDGANRST